MQCGELYRLHSGLTAVISHDQSLVKIPAGALIKVADSLPAGTIFLDAVWQNRKIMLFKTDLERQGQLVKAAKAAAVSVSDVSSLANVSRSVKKVSAGTLGRSAPMEHDEIYRMLQHNLEVAKQKLTVATEKFDGVVGEAPNGLPYPNSVHRIHNASHELDQARKDMLDAHDQLHAFLVHGAVPDDLKKGVEKEISRGEKNEADAS